MLIEVKTKTTRKIDNKSITRTENFVVPDCELFVEAEHTVMNHLSEEQTSGLVENFQIQAIKVSGLNEVCTQYQGDYSYIATLQDTFIDDNGNEKPLNYKVLLFANDLAEAMDNARNLAHQGYNMVITGLKEVNYKYLTATNNE